MKRPRRRRRSEPGDDPDQAPLRLLGLARRAGALALGVDAARRTVKDRRAVLLVTAGDASATQLAKVVPAADRAGVAIRVLATRARLGEAVGGPPLSALAVTDEGLAEQVLLRIPGPGVAGDESK